MDALLDELRLTLVSGIGPRLRLRLLDRFGSVHGTLNAAPSSLREVEGIGPKLAQRIAEAAQSPEAQEELDFCRAHGIDLLSLAQTEYPNSLRTIHDPPSVLFVRGRLLAQDALAVGIVGTRHPTPYGVRSATRLAEGLVRAGLTVVSGLARGIDAAAHRGALAAGGRTVAVLASGVHTIYPPEHAELAEQVAASGALVSETSTRAVPQSGMFPQRNRIISGLSLGVIVVEAADRSGALITAQHANEQGREVFAVPGRIEDRTSRGCHRLIRDGARLVHSLDDVLEELGPLFRPALRESGQEVHHPGELLLNELEQEVLAAIGSDTVSVDQLVQETGLSAPQVLATVSALEIRRLVRRLSANQLARI